MWASSPLKVTGFSGSGAPKGNKPELVIQGSHGAAAVAFIVRMPTHASCLPWRSHDGSVLIDAAHSTKGRNIFIAGCEIAMHFPRFTYGVLVATILRYTGVQEMLQ